MNWRGARKFSHALQSARRLLLLPFLLFVVVVVLGFDVYLANNLTMPIDFRLRKTIGREPTLSPKLKVIALDDSTVRLQSLTALNLKSWAAVLKYIAAQNPKLILIDKVFETPLRDSFSAEFVEEMQGLDVPIVVGAFAQNEEIEGRPVLNLNRSEFVKLPESHVNYHKQAALRFAYGPNPDFILAFDYIGHLMFESHMTARPWLPLGSDLLVPHITFFAADHFEFVAAESLLGKTVKSVVNGVDVPTNRDGAILVNLISPEVQRNTSIRLATIISELASGAKSSNIVDDDVVLVLPSMFTGGGDFKDTPLGPIAGGYLQASLLNSVLTGNWIQLVSLPQLLLLSLLCLVVGFVVGNLLGFGFEILGLIFGAVIIALIAIWGFAYHSLSTSWGTLVFAWGIGGIIGAADRVRMAQGYILRLREALGGLVAKDQLNQIMRNPERLDLSPRIREVTLMFIDLVGFSKLAESGSPTEVFAHLKEVLKIVRKIVLDHGGFIDRSLGDGLLCYFGYNHFPAGSDHGVNAVDNPDLHADIALRCAIALQNANLKYNLDAQKENRISYPMRIGLNTATVCLGDLGDDSKIDFTVIGHGVNLAKRLETACDHYRVMLSEDTMKKIDQRNYPQGSLHLRYASIKHHKELIHAFEFDPFRGNRNELMQAMRYYWSLQGLKRDEQRIDLLIRVDVQLVGLKASGRLLNYSSGGLAIELDKYLASGVVIEFTIDDVTGEVGRACRERRLFPLVAEIRWGDSNGDRYLHGASFLTLNEENASWLRNLLREKCTTITVPSVQL